VPGVLKSPIPNDGPWWPIEDNVAEKTRMIVEDLNRTFTAYGFISDSKFTSYKAPYENVVHSVRVGEDGKWSMYGGDSRSFVTQLNQMFATLNAGLAEARAGRHMVFNDHLVTPAQAAFIIQQMFVAMHPMHDGNGRTSRFLQDLILSLFSMPAASSGDFMDNDILTPDGEYYAAGMNATLAMLATVDNCLEKAYGDQARENGATSERSSKGESTTRVSTPVNAAALNQSKLDYACRILPSSPVNRGDALLAL
jgi:hypothetical protein